MLGNIYEAKPRYELLDELLFNYNNNIQFTNNVNIIIDLKQIYRKIFRSSYSLDSTSLQYLAMEAQRITSDILGIIGHYRNYFYKKNKYTTFYFLYSSDECSSIKELNKNYKQDYYEKYMKSEEDADKVLLLKRCTEALARLTDKLPNCKYLDTSEYDEFIFAKYITNMSLANELNIILSNDENMFQLVSSNVICLTISGLDTKLVSKENLFEYFGVETNLNYGLYSHVLSISGNKKYSIKGIQGFSFKRAIKFIELLVADNKIQNTNYETFIINKNMIPENVKSFSQIIDNLDIAENNFNIFTLNNLYYTNAILKIPMMISKSQKIYSINELERINNNIFTNYPLDLFKCLRGEI